MGFLSRNMTCRLIINLEVLLGIFIFCQKLWEVIDFMGFFSRNMTCWSVIEFDIFARKAHFRQTFWEVVDFMVSPSRKLHIDQLSILTFLLWMFIFCQQLWEVNDFLTCRSIIDCDIVVRNVHFLQAFLISDWIYGIRLEKNNLSINYRFWHFCSKCSFSVSNFEKWLVLWYFPCENDLSINYRF